MIEKEKMSKKKQKALNALQRGSWYGVKPVTRIAIDKKKENKKFACRGGY